jgi:hypothetical protein
MVSPNGIKRVALILAAVLAVAGLLAISFLHARARSDALVAHASEPFQRINSRFCPFRTIEDRGVYVGYIGPYWEFDYDPKYTFPVGPLSVRMSFLGNAISTNPTTALAQLQKSL